MKTFEARLALFLSCALSVPFALQAHDVAAFCRPQQDLTDQEYEALEEVTLGGVTATIAFLSSDEMGGRGTPSPEFDIAARYVASRLLGAGAEGLGPDGSFFVENEIDTERSPSMGSVVIHDGTGIAQQTVLLGSPEAVEYAGSIPYVEDPSDAEDGKPVAVSFKYDSNSPRSAFNQARALAGACEARGAIGVLLLLDEDSPLWEVAFAMQSRSRMINPRQQAGIGVVLVTERDWSSTADSQLVIPTNPTQKEIVRNVAGVIRGSSDDLAEEAVLFSAHLDHLGRRPEGDDRVFNGADDDASGVTAVLTLADAYGALETKPSRSVVFVTYWGEERGLLGSREFVEDSPWPLEDIVANINIEMIGRPEENARNKMWVTGWNESDLGAIVNDGSRRVGVETFEHASFSEMLYSRSDNWAFVQKDVVAHSFSAGSLHDDYHQPSDEWTKLDLPHMTQIIRGLFAGTLPIAHGEKTPTPE